MNLFFWATLYYLEFHDFKTAKALYVFTLLFCLFFSRHRRSTGLFLSRWNMFSGFRLR